jgi:[acyl-carrier-protein] S-malonyltransferase
VSKTAILFPGQGSQAVGMGRDVHESSPAARAVFEQANAVLGFDLAKLCFEGPADQLERTDIQQPAIFVTSAALWAAYREAGGGAVAFARTGGLSLGEYTALFAAGAVAFEDALRLVHERGRLMQDAAVAVPSGMVSLLGGDADAAQRLCDECRGDDVLVPANYNCPGQIVLSGGREACRRAAEKADAFGFRPFPLAVAGAFHSPLMQPAADGLWAALSQTTFRAPAVPVVANVSAAYHDSPDTIRAALRDQLTRPVLWQQCVERLIADGVETFVEVGPGRVLAGLMRKIDRTRKTLSINSAEAIAAAKQP